ncbi:MAG: uroporphyrinogen decarboxylase [Clostridiales Family XIII bacterium]|nr:uroporphyrinogen decarboxylase [Clostridiales Family XIII bacterium]
MNGSNDVLKERLQLRADLLSGKKPKRVFVYPRFMLESACGLAGISLIEAHYSPDLMAQAFDKVCATFYADANPLTNTRYPAVYQILGSKSWILGSNGAMQHPEIETMMPEDYDDFIAAPYETILERFLPRACAAMDADPMSQSLTLAKAVLAHKKITGQIKASVAGLLQKYSLAPGIANHQMIEAPFDFLSDLLRGFRGVTMDARRIPDKVEAAVEAILPLMLKLATPATPRPGLCCFVPLHLAPFIGMKQFERLYWPTLEKMVAELDKQGIACALFAEQDWTRYADYLASLPASTALYFEGGDPELLLKTVGAKHPVGGFFDPTVTLTRSKEDCIDEAKRLVEIGMKNDHFYFTFDRQVMDANSLDIPKLQAVLEWVRENAVY